MTNQELYIIYAIGIIFFGLIGCAVIWSIPREQFTLRNGISVLVGVTTLFLAFASFWLSFNAVRDEAIKYGLGRNAFMAPLVVDGVLILISAKRFYDEIHGKGGYLSFVALVVYTVLTVLMNWRHSHVYMISVEITPWTIEYFFGVIYYVIAPVSLLVSTETFIDLMRDVIGHEQKEVVPLKLVKKKLESAPEQTIQQVVHQPRIMASETPVTVALVSRAPLDKKEEVPENKGEVMSTESEFDLVSLVKNRHGLPEDKCQWVARIISETATAALEQRKISATALGEIAGVSRETANVTRNKFVNEIEEYKCFLQNRGATATEVHSSI